MNRLLEIRWLYLSFFFRLPSVILTHVTFLSWLACRFYRLAEIDDHQPNNFNHDFTNNVNVKRIDTTYTFESKFDDATIHTFERNLYGFREFRL